MKRLLPLLVLFILSFMDANAQSVVATCSQTGVYGIAYSSEGSPMTMKECRDKALKECEKNGGKTCKVYKESAASGWHSFGIQPYAPYQCSIGTGGSEAEAYADMVVNYTLDGGKNINGLTERKWNAAGSGKK